MKIQRYLLFMSVEIYIYIVTGCDLDLCWIPSRDINYFLDHRVQIGSGSTQHPVHWIAGASSPGVKRPEREAKQLPQSVFEVMNSLIYSSTPL
jgi:hypothetical protein